MVPCGHRDTPDLGDPGVTASPSRFVSASPRGSAVVSGVSARIARDAQERLREASSGGHEQQVAAGGEEAQARSGRRRLGPLAVRRVYGGGGGFGFDELGEQQMADSLVAEAIVACSADRASAGRFSRRLTEPGGPVSLGVLAATLRRRLDSLVADVVGGGWGPRDLVEITSRRLGPCYLPLLAALLATVAKRYPPDRVVAQWQAQLADLGDPTHPSLRGQPGLELALGLAGLLAGLPRIEALLPPPGTAGSLRADASVTDASQHKVLARVRALLANAESTDFPEEAEALSAKAQELISRHSLDRLAASAASRDGAGPAAVVVRRLWLEAPYVLPKALLAGQVARANRCSCVISERLGFVTLVGTAEDLDAVEVLVTSLLVQGNAALLRAGRQVGWDGTSRTRSFRRSFLVSYATRIGERLREADGAAFAASSVTAALVPLLRDHSERVEAAVREVFPTLVERDVQVSNTAGWAEGRAAADLALLDMRQEVDRGGAVA